MPGRAHKSKQKIMEFPSELKRALVDDAEEQGTNMNDVAVAVIAAAFNHPFTPSGKATPGLTDATRTGLWLPPALLKKINMRAARESTRSTTLIIDVLLLHYDLAEAA